MSEEEQETAKVIAIEVPLDGENLEETAKTIADALQAINDGLQQTAQIFWDALEDAWRDNAYHPDGPVVHSTIELLSDRDAEDGKQ